MRRARGMTDWDESAAICVVVILLVLLAIGIATVVSKAIKSGQADELRMFKANAVIYGYGRYEPNIKSGEPEFVWNVPAEKDIRQKD